jgi:hypothetical protein
VKYITITIYVVDRRVLNSLCFRVISHTISGVLIIFKKIKQIRRRRK